MTSPRSPPAIFASSCFSSRAVIFSPALGEHVMPDHKFHTNQTVFLSPAHARNVPGGAYIVTKKLPINNGECEYRVKSVNEPFERVVRESQLRNVAD